MRTQNPLTSASPARLAELTESPTAVLDRHPILESIEQRLLSRLSQRIQDNDDVVPLRAGDRVFPRIANHSVATTPVIPENLRKLLPPIVDGLPFHRCPKSGRDLQQLFFQAFVASTTTLADLFGDIGRFMHALLDANIEVRTDWLTDRRKTQLMQQKKQELAAFLPRLAFRPPNIGTVELYNQPEYIIRGTFEIALRECCEQLIITLADMLDLLVDMEMVGIVDWKGRDSCRFHFFKHVVLEETKGTRLLTHTSVLPQEPGTGVTERMVTRRRETDVEHTHRHARHIHEVINAQNIGLPVRNLPMPQRVKDLIAAVPSWIQPAMRIITGTEIRRVVIEQDLRTERKTEVEETTTIHRHEEVAFRPDPAVVIGFYVLTGWGEEEVLQKG